MPDVTTHRRVEELLRCIFWTYSSDITTSVDDKAGSKQKEVGFQLFEKLPTEIRIMIWRLAFLPRRINMNQLTNWTGASNYIVNLQLIHSEATDVLLENYTRVYTKEGRLTNYINYSIDSVCFPRGSHVWPFFMQMYPSRVRLKWLEIPADGHMPSHDDLVALLTEMPSQKLILIRIPPRPHLQPNDWRYAIAMVIKIDQLRKALSKIDITSRPALAVLCPSQTRLQEDIYAAWAWQKELTAAIPCSPLALKPLLTGFRTVSRWAYKSSGKRSGPGKATSLITHGLLTKLS
jgi:hypothetical protein